MSCNAAPPMLIFHHVRFKDHFIQDPLVMQQTLDAVNSVLLLESITRHTNFSTDHQGKGVIYHFKTLPRTQGEPQDMGRNCFSFVPKYIGGGPRGKQLSNNSFRITTFHSMTPLTTGVPKMARVTAIDYLLVTS